MHKKSFCDCLPERSASFMSGYRIFRDYGLSDDITGQVFDSYDAAYAVLERYYADICCSDDREYYRIVEASEDPPAW